MCTVTIIPRSSQGLRMVCNRDEQHSRAAARPPRLHQRDGVRWLMPVDPDSGGTWVEGSDAGVVATLLNLNPPELPVMRTTPQSRGAIIPHVIGAGDFAAACIAARAMDASIYRPFRLVIADGHRLAVFVGDGVALNETTGELLPGPWMMTSSGLGDHLVEQPRRELFNGWFGSDPEGWAAEQDRFHQHRWEDRPELSVNMHRDDARTVSACAVELDERQVVMCYRGDGPTDAIVLQCELPLKQPSETRSPSIEVGE